MSRSNLVRVVLVVLCGLVPLIAAAQHALEIIALRYRTVEQVLPALQPLVEPGGTLSGSRGQLFLRASPANVAEIRRALESIDRPSRRLQISVRYDDAAASAQRDLAARGVVSNSGSRVTITADDRRSSSAERVDQRLQVIEGGRAFIFTGQSRPLRVPGGGAEIQDIATGFAVTPRLSGDRVMLEIAAQKQSPGPRGSVQGERAASVLSARLGEWVEIAGVDAGLNANSGAAVQSRRVWVKVEESN